MWRRILTGIVFFTFFLLQTAKADWYITRQTNDKFGNKSFGFVFIRDSIIRFDKPTSTSLINFNKKQVTLIFAQHRAYWQGTIDDLKKTTSQMAENQLTKLLAYAPEDQKQQIKQALEAFKKNQQKPDSLKVFPHVTVKNTGITDTLLGYPAQEYDIIIDSTLKQKIWITRKVKPYTRYDINRIMSFSKAMNPFAIENALGHSKEYMQLLYNGFILKSVNFTSDGNVITTRVTHIKKMKIPDPFFEIPPGYIESSLQNIMLLDLKNNILKPQNIAPDDDNNNGLPPLPPPINNHDIDPKPY